MKNLITVFLIFVNLFCFGQEPKQDDLLLTISPVIDKADINNKLIINDLKEFLKSKNQSVRENKYWLKEDFNKYIFPFIDIFNIENSKFGKNFYQPTLMDIIKTENASQRILKIAFLGYNPTTKENQLKSIYNIVANIDGEKVLFSRYTDFVTTDWKTVKENSITYKISPLRNANQNEIQKQKKDIQKLTGFFNSEPIPITYFSCINPVELFQIKGFDYNPMMYADKSGGLADYGNIIYSGNNSESYTHEIVHIYTNKLFPNIDKFIDEGLATYIAGSGKFDYNWQRQKFLEFLKLNKDFDFSAHVDPYERLYFQDETPVPYLVSALILERTFRIYGKNKLIELLKSNKDFWTNINEVGITRSNINEELRKEINLPVKSIF